ncbi:MAG TPA: protealysin inhibitor emfourin [Thermoanaerobaculia bacterium]|nr:protealysin inhibitor emfourin [Thermoanaerobaculia bacterium]
MRTLLLALALAGSCNTADPMTPALHVSLATDGGLSGRGLGSVDVVGREVTTEKCRATLTDEEASELARLAKAAKPESWKSEYGQQARPDQVHYTLTVEGHSTSWWGENPSDLPAEIRALRESLWKIRARACS